MKENLNGNALPPQEMERLWSWLINEANLYTNRLNFYVLVQSMFFVAFASYSGKAIYFYIACSLAGIFLSLVWILISRNQNNNVVIPLRRLIYAHWLVGNQINSRQKKVLRTHFILGIILPCFLILIWILILFSELSQYF